MNSINLKCAFLSLAFFFAWTITPRSNKFLAMISMTVMQMHVVVNVRNVQHCRISQNFNIGIEMHLCHYRFSYQHRLIAGDLFLCTIFYRLFFTTRFCVETNTNENPYISVFHHFRNRCHIPSSIWSGGSFMNWHTQVCKNFTHLSGHTLKLYVRMFSNIP